MNRTLDVYTKVKNGMLSYAWINERGGIVFGSGNQGDVYRKWFGLKTKLVNSGIYDYERLIGSFADYCTYDNCILSLIGGDYYPNLERS